MFFVGIVIVIFLMESLVKNYIEKNKNFEQEEEILDGNITIQKFHNRGVAMNFLEKKPHLILGITGAMIGVLLVIFGYVLPKKGNILTKIGLSLLLGGALSNLTDRIMKGYVTDYFSFTKIKQLKNIVFNLADMFIFVGGIILVIASLLKKK